MAIENVSSHAPVRGHHLTTQNSYYDKEFQVMPP